MKRTIDEPVEKLLSHTTALTHAEDQADEYSDLEPPPTDTSTKHTQHEPEELAFSNTELSLVDGEEPELRSKTSEKVLINIDLYNLHVDHNRKFQDKTYRRAEYLKEYLTVAEWLQNMFILSSPELVHLSFRIEGWSHGQKAEVYEFFLTDQPILYFLCSVKTLPFVEAVKANPHLARWRLKMRTDLPWTTAFDPVSTSGTISTGVHNMDCDQVSSNTVEHLRASILNNHIADMDRLFYWIKLNMRGVENEFIKEVDRKHMDMLDANGNIMSILKSREEDARGVVNEQTFIKTGDSSEAKFREVVRQNLFCHAVLLSIKPYVIMDQTKQQTEFKIVLKEVARDEAEVRCGAARQCLVEIMANTAGPFEQICNNAVNVPSFSYKVLQTSGPTRSDENFDEAYNQSSQFLLNLLASYTVQKTRLWAWKIFGDKFSEPVATYKMEADVLHGFISAVADFLSGNNSNSHFLQFCKRITTSLVELGSGTSEEIHLCLNLVKERLERVEELYASNAQWIHLDGSTNTPNDIEDIRSGRMFCVYYGVASENLMQTSFIERVNTQAKAGGINFHLVVTDREYKLFLLIVTILRTILNTDRRIIGPRVTEAKVFFDQLVLKGEYDNNRTCFMNFMKMPTDSITMKNNLALSVLEDICFSVIETYMNNLVALIVCISECSNKIR